jgi:hypothetical protein
VLCACFVAWCVCCMRGQVNLTMYLDTPQFKNLLVCPLLHRKPPTRPHSALARSPSSLVWLQSLARSSVCVCMFAAEEGSGAASPLCGCAGRCRPNQLPPAPRTHPQGKFAAAAMQRHAEPTIRACRSCTTGSHAATGTQLFVCLFVCFGLFALASVRRALER